MEVGGIQGIVFDDRLGIGLAERKGKHRCTDFRLRGGVSNNQVGNFILEKALLIAAETIVSFQHPGLF